MAYIKDTSVFDWHVVPKIVTKNGVKYWSFPFKGYYKGNEYTDELVYDMCETVAKNTVMDTIGFISNQAKEEGFKDGFKEGIVIGAISAFIGATATFIIGDICRRKKEDEDETY